MPDLDPLAFTPEEQALLKVAKAQGLSPREQEDVAKHVHARAAIEDEQEALGSVTADPLMRPDLWPMLERPRNPQEFGEAVLAVSQTRAGRLLINELVVGFLLASASDIPAERHQGQADVVRYLLQHLGLGYSRGGPHVLTPHDSNPWRNQNG